MFIFSPPEVAATRVPPKQGDGSQTANRDPEKYTFKYINLNKTNKNFLALNLPHELCSAHDLIHESLREHDSESEIQKMKKKERAL